MHQLKHLAIAQALAALTFTSFACTRTEWNYYIGTQAQAESADTEIQEWGNGKALNAEQSALFSYLGWPQTYTDIVGTFGYPEKRGTTTDYYLSHDGQWIAVYYDQNNNAIGYGYESP